jgi:hypothetical protein
MDTSNFADRQREHDATDVSLRLVFGAEYTMLSSSDARNVRADYLAAFRAEACTVSAYRDRIGRGNLQSYAASIRRNEEAS